MKAISVRQPWAWSIIHGGKPIENRSRRTRHRGALLIHAAMGMSNKEFEDWSDFVRGPHALCDPNDFRDKRGGFIGVVDLVDCIISSPSPWFFGPVGYVLANPRPIKFIPIRGERGIFDVNIELTDLTILETAA